MNKLFLGLVILGSVFSGCQRKVIRNYEDILQSYDWRLEDSEIISGPSSHFVRHPYLIYFQEDRECYGKPFDQQIGDMDEKLGKWEVLNKRTLLIGEDELEILHLDEDKFIYIQKVAIVGEEESLVFEITRKGVKSQIEAIKE